MSKELEKYKGTNKSTLGRLAGTVHPNDSASQVSSNLLFEEGQEAGGNAVKRIADTRAKQEAENQSRVSTNSRALTQGSSSNIESSISKASPRRPKGLRIEDVSSTTGRSTVDKSAVSSNSEALVPVKTNAADLSSSLSKTSSVRSSRSPAGSVSASQASDASRTKKSIPRSSTSSVSPVSKPSTSSSQVSKASSSQSNGRSTTSSTSQGSSRMSGHSRALVPSDQGAVRASPLRNEVRAEDLNDDMYSISIHERGALQDLPSRAKMLEIIMKQNPQLEIDEATAIAENRIASSSALGRSAVGRSIAPASVVSRAERSSVSKASTSRPSGSSTLSAASSSRSKALEKFGTSSVVPAAPARPRPNSSVSKASTSYSQEIVRGTVHPLSEVSAISCSKNKNSAASSLARNNTAPTPPAGPLTIADFGGRSTLSSFNISTNSNESATTDLLAITQLREQSEARRAQAMKDLIAQHESAGSDLARKRMIELEVSKQALANTQLESQLQEFSIQTAKLGDLQRHAHEDKIAALERAQLCENARKTDALIDAMRERSQLEKARNREKRGDIAKAERDREDERNIRVQKDYERMDHDRVMEHVDSFGRIVEASRPREIPQPRRTGVTLEHSHRYKNPQTGGDGVVNMRIHKGCKSIGDGDCPNCGLPFIEHPVVQQRDGSVLTRTGRRIMPGADGNRPGGSSLSKVSSARK